MQTFFQSNGCTEIALINIKKYGSGLYDNMSALRHHTFDLEQGQVNSTIPKERSHTLNLNSVLSIFWKIWQ